MREHIAQNFEELHRILDAYGKDYTWVYRGQADARWKLIPKAGRIRLTVDNERTHFFTWKRRAVEYTSANPRTNWDWIAIAQHHGLATRLLDWSTNPLVAAYFATLGVPECDGALYALNCRSEVPYDEVEPLDYEGIALYRPFAVAARISRQSAIFTVHGPAESILDDSTRRCRVEKIIIPDHCRDALRDELSYYGFNSLNIFPDLDGLSSFINWIATKRDLTRKFRLERMAPDPPPVE